MGVNNGSALNRSPALLLLATLLLLPVTLPASPVKSASEFDYPPFALVLEDGSADGFSVELMRAALAAMGREVNFATGPWARIKEDLATGRLDALPLVGRTPERENIFDFTVPYITLYGAVFIREHDEIADIEALHQRRVGVLRGDNTEEFLRREGLGDHLITTSTTEEALLMLSRGELDAVVSQRLVALNLIEQLKLTNIKTGIAPLQGFRQEFCFAVTEGDKALLAQLNEGLAVVIADGTYQKLREKWLGILDREKQQRLVLLELTSLFAGLLVLLLVLLYLLQHWRAHRQLLVNNERLQQLVQSMPVILDAVDEKGNIIVWNQEAERATGYPAEEILNDPAAWEKLYPDRDYRERMLAEWQARGDHRDWEWQLTARDGSRKSIEWSNISSQYPIPGWASWGIGVDVTDRRSAEAAQVRQLGILDSAKDYIGIADREGNTVYVNKAGRKMLELDPTEDLSSLSIPDFHPPESAQLLSSVAIPTAIEKGAWEGESQFQTRDGRRITTSQILVAHRDDRGEVSHFSTIARDIGERKRIEEKLLQSEQRYRAAFDQAAVGIARVAPDGSWLEVNQKLCDIVGYSREELLKLTFQDITYPDDLEADLDQVKKVLDGNIQTYSMEKRYIRKQGDLVWINLTVSLVRNRDASPRYFIAIIEEIQARKQAEQNLTLSESRYRLLVETLHLMVWEYSLEEDRFTYVSPQAEEMLGYPVSDWTDAKPGLEFWATVIHPEDRDKAVKFCSDSTSQGLDHSFDYRAITTKGQVLWLRDIVSVRFDPQGRPAAMIGCMLDISERKQIEEEQRLAANVFTHTLEGITITDAEGTIIDINDAFTRITGYRREEAIGQNPRILKSERQGEAYYKAMWQDLTENGHWYGEIWNRRKSGEVYAAYLSISAVRDNQGRVSNYIGVFSDITAQKHHQRQLEHIAHYDALTDLPNRVLLADRLQLAMAQTQRRDQKLAVAYLDLDGFKEVNDRHGHEVGDQLLIGLAGRLRQVLREGDTIARLGGDEFVVILIDLTRTRESLPLLNRLLGAAAKPNRVGELVLQVSASLGVTFYPQAEEVSADQLLRQADQAMYQAKLTGKNRFHLFDTEQDRSVRGHHETLERIQRGVVRKEFLLHYQPMVNMRSGEIIGAEALVRWNHPKRGLLTPGHFLPLIQDHQLAIDMDLWVIDSVLHQMKGWNELGLNLDISVNISAQLLQQPDFVQRLKSLLSQHPEADPGQLILEVLETSALEDMALVSSVMERCSKLGIRFALDDFGTGYSSLTYLKRLPATRIKVDQTFVRDMLDDPEDLAIVEGVLGLAIAFRREPLAEGVETLEQGVLLLQLGCDLAQGYTIARPMPADQVPGWASEWHPPAAWRDRNPVEREEIPLLFASVEHRAWVRAIESYLKGERITLPPLDHNRCRFGQWLNQMSAQDQSHGQLVQELQTLHQRVHHLSGELLELKERDKGEDALQRLAELHELRDRLLMGLRTLSDQHLS